MTAALPETVLKVDLFPGLAPQTLRKWEVKRRSIFLIAVVQVNRNNQMNLSLMICLKKRKKVIKYQCLLVRKYLRLKVLKKTAAQFRQKDQKAFHQSFQKLVLKL